MKEENVFKTLLCLDTIRGPDSTGVLAVSDNSLYDIFKKVGTPWNCYGEKEFEKLFKYTNVLLLGHNRWATVGIVTDENAHPFDVGDIIGVHNGTIRQERKLDDHQMFDVDSQTVLHNFAKNGVAQTCKILDGAYAVVFYDKRDHTIHMLRNKERPLWFVYSKDMKTLLWASEPWMLQIACARHGLEIGEVKELPEMLEHSFELPRVAPYKVDELPEMTKVPFVKEEHKYEVVPWKYTPPAPPKGSHLRVVQAVKQQGYEKLLAFINKDIKFSVVGPVEGKHQKFIRAYAELPEADVIEIRIFMDGKNKKYANLVGMKDKIWEGHVKRVNSLGLAKGYLLLDNRTIKPADPRKVDGIIEGKEKIFNLHHGEITDAQGWLDKTAIGCDNCGGIPQFRDAPDLEWYEQDKFFCKRCFQTQSVQNFLHLLASEG